MVLVTIFAPAETVQAVVRAEMASKFFIAQTDKPLPAKMPARFARQDVQACSLTLS
jgi:hypothetical protein